MLVNIKTKKISHKPTPISHNYKMTVSPFSSRLRYTSLAFVNQNRIIKVSISVVLEALHGSLGMLEFEMVWSAF